MEMIIKFILFLNQFFIFFSQLAVAGNVYV